MPGLSWIRETPESLVLYLPHGELSIAGGDLSRVAEAVLERATESPILVEDLVEGAVQSCNVRDVIVRYALRQLKDARCLRELDGEITPSELDWLFWSRTGTRAASERIAAARLHCICHANSRDVLERSLTASSIGHMIESFPNNCTSETAAVRLAELAETAEVLLVAGPRFSHPFTRLLGRAAVKLGVPVLFVEMSGFIARVGPTLFGRDLPCIDCLNARHAANGGVPLSRTADDLSTASAADLPPPQLAHPNLSASAFNLASIEACRIVLGDGPQTFGGYLELEWCGEVKRREVHRVPLCSGCADGGIERFPYHVTPITAGAR